MTALEAINTVVEENHPEIAKKLGNKIANKSENLKEKYPDLISDVRGKGLLHGIVFKGMISQLSK